MRLRFPHAVSHASQERASPRKISAVRAISIPRLLSRPRFAIPRPDGADALGTTTPEVRRRSEERRVGKECGSRWERERKKKNVITMIDVTNMVIVWLL